MGDLVTTCWASVKRTLADGSTQESRCKNPPMHNQRVCQFHGGRSPKAKEAAAERGTIKEVNAVLARFGVPVEADPKEVLLHQIKVAHGNALVLEQMLADVDAEDVASDDPQV